MLKNYWNRVIDYRYDPIMTHADGSPIPPVILPRVFPTTRVWLAALYFAFWK